MLTQRESYSRVLDLDISNWDEALVIPGFTVRSLIIWITQSRRNRKS